MKSYEPVHDKTLQYDMQPVKDLLVYPGSLIRVCWLHVPSAASRLSKGW